MMYGRKFEQKDSVWGGVGVSRTRQKGKECSKNKLAHHKE